MNAIPLPPRPLRAPVRTAARQPRRHSAAWLGFIGATDAGWLVAGLLNHWPPWLLGLDAAALALVALATVLVWREDGR